MKKSAILSAALAATMFPFQAFAAEESCNVHVYMHIYKDVVDCDLTVTDVNHDGTLTKEDALILVHDKYYSGGAEYGYANDSFIWGMCGSFYYFNTGKGEQREAIHALPEESQRITLQDGDSLEWYLEIPYEESCHVYSEYLDERKGETVPQGVVLKIAVNHLIPSQSMEEPVPDAEITINGKGTGIRTNESGWATIRLDTLGVCAIGTNTTAFGVPSDYCYYVTVVPEDEYYGKPETAAPAAIVEQSEAEEGTAPAEVKAAKAETAAAKAVKKNNTEPKAVAVNAAETKHTETKAAETAEAPAKAENVSAVPVQAEDTAAEQKHSTTMQNAVTKLPANAPAAQSDAALTTGEQSENSVSTLVMVLLSTGVAVLATALFSIFRKLH